MSKQEQIEQTIYQLLELSILKKIQAVLLLHDLHLPMS